MLNCCIIKQSSISAQVRFVISLFAAFILLLEILHVVDQLQAVRKCTFHAVRVVQDAKMRRG